MPEIISSWKRVVLWPSFEVGLRKSAPRNLSFLFVLIVVVVSMISVANGDWWSELFWGPIAYGLFGLVWWSVFQFNTHWPRFAVEHQTVAKLLRALILVFAWEAKVLLASGNASTRLRYWFWVLVALGWMGYGLLHAQTVDRLIAYAIMGSAEILSECTGIYLAYREWRKPKSEEKE
mgnify:FL=1